MSSSAAAPELGGSSDGRADATAAARRVAGLWWVSLIVGIAWIATALVILQFDDASIKTVGILVGVMFTVAGLQQLVLSALAESLRWLWAVFGVLFLISAGICFVNPEDTFAGLADILGFLFLIVGVWWTIEAFLVKGESPLWWLGLISGALMIVMAFWTSGQFFIEKAYVLLVFAGIWALMHGMKDIVRAFALRSVRDLL
jgi:uncharacterized membrane protein HdeD (DUF308 family)